MKYLLLLLTSTYLVSCFPPPHPAVVAVRREEDLLPPHLRSPALHNPHLQEVLPLASLLHHGEMVVYEREADKVTRQEIYNILTHAGLVSRRPHQRPPPQYHHHHRPTGHQHHYAPNHQNFYDPPFFPSPELLQHL